MNEEKIKIIGAIGGTSYVSTPPYLIRLNELVAEAMGAPTSARILLWNINYGPIKRLYTAPGGWDRIPALFAQEYLYLAGLKPECIILANNTLHKAFNIVKDALPLDIPFFHAVTLTRDHCVAHGYRKILFTGTAFTMTDDYFVTPLREAGLEIVIPNEADKAAIQVLQTDVSVKGIVTDQHKIAFAAILDHYLDVEAVILACTELPLIAPPSTPYRAIVNPAELQCQAAVAFALKPSDRE